MKNQITLIVVVTICALATASYKPYKPSSSYRPISRPGRCGLNAERSGERCFSDRDCFGDGECCDRRGVLRRGYCYYQRRINRNGCQRIIPGTAGICIQECSRDFDCNRNEICCSNGCGYTCVRRRGSGRSYEG